MNILILGHNGMLGHMLVKYFTGNGYNVSTINDRFPSKEFMLAVENFSGDFIINAIGAIPQKTSDFNVNTTLPGWLDKNLNVKIIHPGTDCEMDDDDYGLSKKASRDYIITHGKRTKILKSSIIGPELQDKKSLLEWFLNLNSSSCDGYTHAMWNGITTYEWAKQSELLMNNWDTYGKETIISGNCVSKYSLLRTISHIFDKHINIVPIDKGIDKCLISNIKTHNIDEQLKQLKEYYYDN
jgi:dTDP-4-dehydrorhamnose reductase